MVVERRGYAPADESGFTTEGYDPIFSPFYEYPNIRFHTGTEPSLEVEELIVEVDDFARRVSERFGRAVIEWMEQSPHEIELRLYDRIIHEGAYMPTFDLYDANAAEEFLQSLACPQEAEIVDDGFLIVYKLPQPLADYWEEIQNRRAGKGDFGKLNIEYDMSGDDRFIQNPPWGEIYFDTRKIFWDEFVEGEKASSSLGFQRIGKPKVHDPAVYHYLITVWPKEQALVESGDIFSPDDLYGKAS